MPYVSVEREIGGRILKLETGKIAKLATGAVIVTYGESAVLAAAVGAAVVGLIFPWLLWRAGRDPALGSGPVATIVQDVLSILIYFLMVVLFVT